MNAIWQDIAALGLVGAAVAYVCYRIWSSALGRGRGCGGCRDSCSETLGDEKPLVQIASRPISVLGDG